MSDPAEPIKFPIARPITDWRGVAMFFADVLVMDRPEYADLVLQVIREKLEGTTR